MTDQIVNLVAAAQNAAAKKTEERIARLDERIARLAKPIFNGPHRVDRDMVFEASQKVVQQLTQEDVIWLAQEAVEDRLRDIFRVVLADADWEMWVAMIKDLTEDEPLVQEIALGILGEGTAWGYLADRTDVNLDEWFEAGRRDHPQATVGDIARANRLVASVIRANPRCYDLAMQHIWQDMDTNWGWGAADPLLKRERT